MHTISNNNIVILDTSEINDPADYGGMMYMLKLLVIKDGESYQIDNAGNLLMYYDAYNECRHLLKAFGIKSIIPKYKNL